jgi:hypothetical protein
MTDSAWPGGRQATRESGSQASRVLALPGWEDRSLCGRDAYAGSWWAQLWHNELPDGSPIDGPDFGFGPDYGRQISTLGGTGWPDGPGHRLQRRRYQPDPDEQPLR